MPGQSVLPRFFLRLSGNSLYRKGMCNGMLIKKAAGKSVGVAVGILIGVAVSVAITLISCMILAWLISVEKIALDSMNYGAGVVLMLASFLGALMAVGRIKRMRTQVCLMTGGAYYLMLLSITALFFSGRYKGCGLAAIFVFAGCGLAALLGIKEKKGRKYKIKNRSIC